MSVTQHTQYDVIIVGGGMVGASLACALQQAPENLSLRVLLIESSPVNVQGQPQQPSFDARSTVLSYGTTEYFRQLNLWGNISEFAEAIKNIHVSDQGKFGAVRMNCEEQGVDALGYVVENRALGFELNKAMVEADRIEVCSSAQVLELKPKANGTCLRVEKSDEEFELQTKLVVLAEGGRSGLCEKLGIYRSKKSYEQVAIIANVGLSQAHLNIAYERFTPKGPMAFLPLNDIGDEHRAALVWTQPVSNAEEVMALDDERFLEKIQLDFGNRLGEFSKVGARVSYPLSLQQAEEQSRSGLVLLGNVAQSLHPVAGQGFNLALRNTLYLAENIINSIKQGQNPGSAENLQTYCETIENDQDKTIAFSHYMTGLFSSENEVLVWARKFGLFSIDLIPPLKKSLGQQAMGVSERMISL